MRSNEDPVLVDVNIQSVAKEHFISISIQLHTASTLSR